MLKKLFTTLTAGTLAAFLVTACAEESKDSGNSALVKVPEPVEKTDEAVSPDSSVMGQPVNFSTAEDVEKSLQNIREKAGDDEYNRLKMAMQYIMVYDLSVGNNKQKLYKKLDGKTPEQIHAMTKR